MPLKYLFTCLFLAVLISPVWSQTCCSAGSPILSALNFSAGSEGQGQVTLSYEFNAIKDVLSESREIEPFRQRSTRSYLLDVSYGFYGRWSATLLFTFLEQERRLNARNSFGSLEQLTTRGIGDAVFLVKYSFIQPTFLQQQLLAAGLGVKAPLGRSDLRNDEILLPADMQPGTGSWDMLLWASYNMTFRPDPYSFFTAASYRINGENDRFSVGSGAFSGYTFGNILSFSAGTGYSLSWMELSGQLRWRYSAADVFAGDEVPNTGGHWLYLVPAVNLNYSPYGFRISGRIPLYRNLNGIQLTTSYAITASLFYTFN